MNPSMADKLIEIMARQFEAHQELLRGLHAQQGAIRRFDAEGLERLREQADRIVERIVDLEDARRQLVGQNVRISQVIEQLPEPERSRLAGLSAGLRELAGQIASLNRVNGSAINTMLDHFHSMYRMMAGANRPIGYSKTGRATEQTNSSFLVDAVA